VDDVAFSLLGSMVRHVYSKVDCECRTRNGGPSVYLPCMGTPGRLLSYEDILAEIESEMSTGGRAPKGVGSGRGDIY